MIVFDCGSVGGWYIARVQYFSLGEGAAVVSLGAVQRETGEGQTRTDDETLIMDDMKME